MRRALIGLVAPLLLAGCGGSVGAGADLSARDAQFCKQQVADLARARAAVKSGDAGKVLDGTDAAVQALVGYDVDDEELARLAAKTMDALGQVNLAAQEVRLPGQVAEWDLRPAREALGDLGDWCDARGA